MRPSPGPPTRETPCAQSTHARSPRSQDRDAISLDTPAPPAPPQQPPAAPQRQDDAWDYDAPMTVDLGGLRDHSTVRRLVAMATDVKWAPLPSVFVSQPSVRVRVGGVPVVLPGTWEIVVGRSSTGVETIYGLDRDGALHLVMLRGNGEPAELVGMPPEAVEYLLDLYYPRSTS